MKRTAAAFLACITLCLVSWPCSWADVTLDGYTFSDDSTDLWLCPYYNHAYDRIVDIGLVLHGYGAFAGKDITQNFSQTFPVAGVNCDVILERGYIPTYNPESSIFSLDYYDGYIYLAKDIDDNIHILTAVYYMPDSSTVSWDYTDLSQVGTTLAYPASPVVGQAVFGGHVESLDVKVGDNTDAVTLTLDSLPQFPSQTITAYLRPGRGVIAYAYNWEGGLNGFSLNGGAPEQQEESQSTWEEWTDKNCFISACSF
jgi:hypothetical protein